MNLRVILLTVNHKITLTVIFIALLDIILYYMVMITPAQIRAARALLNWKQTELAKAADVSEMSIKNIERGATDPRVSTIQAIRTALENAGVLFIDQNGAGAGVRLRDRQD